MGLGIIIFSFAIIYWGTKKIFRGIKEYKENPSDTAVQSILTLIGDAIGGAGGAGNNLVNGSFILVIGLAMAIWGFSEL